LGLAAATIAFAVTGVGTAAATTTAPKTVAWGNVLLAEGAHSHKIARLGVFHLTAVCTSLGEGDYFLKSSVAAFVYGEDGSPEAMLPNKAYLISDDVDYDEAFYAYAPKTGETISGNTFRWTPSNLGGSNCEFQGHMTQTS
jgi:hypothetical protein